MALVDPKWSYTGGLDARGSFTSAATMGRHFDGLVSTVSGYPCSLAGAQEFWIGPWLGLASELAGNRHVRSWPVRGKHDHDFDIGQMHGRSRFCMKHGVVTPNDCDAGRRDR